MLRTITCRLALLLSSSIAGCSAGGAGAQTSSHGGTASAGGGGATGSAGHAGVGGTSVPTGGGGSAGSLGAGGSSASGGVSGAGTAGAAGSLAAAGSAGTGTAGSTSSTPPLFSDDFEGAVINTTKWTPRINSDPMSVFSLDTSQKHGGAQSLHLKQAGFSSMLAAEGAPIFPAPNNEYYGRVWLRVSSGGTGQLPSGHVIWVETGDVTNDTHEVRVGANKAYFQSNLWPGDTDIRDPAALMTTDAWHCLQLHYGTDLLDVTLDGVHSSISTTNWVAADSANGSNSTPKSKWSPTYAAFRIGWELGGGEIWFDDVALDHVPVPCN